MLRKYVEREEASAASIVPDTESVVGIAVIDVDVDEPPYDDFVI